MPHLRQSPLLIVAEDRVARQCDHIDRLVERGQHHQVEAAYRTLAELERAMRALRKSTALQAWARR